VVLIHYYQNAIVATTMRHKDEVKDPVHFTELKDLPEAGMKELALMTKIVDKMTKGPRPQIVPRRLHGEVAQVEWRSRRSLRPRA
jgi:non-homologous end joining protein Ku